MTALVSALLRFKVQDLALLGCLLVCCRTFLVFRGLCNLLLQQCVLKDPIWRHFWSIVSEHHGGSSKFPACDEFLDSAVAIYQHLQSELLAAEHIGHLEDLFAEDLWPIVRAAHSDFHPVRQQFGAENCKINWRATEAYVAALSSPKVEEEAKETKVLAGARIFSIMSMAFDPEEVRHSIDDLIFESAFDDTNGVENWRIVHISGPRTSE
eukprot:s2892_g1.t1